MSFDLSLSASGQLSLQGEITEAAAELQRRFQTGNASAFVFMTVHELIPGSGRACHYFRDMVHGFLIDVSLSDAPAEDPEALRKQIYSHIPEPDKIQRIADAVPPFSGSRYAVPEWFSVLFAELAEYCVSEIRASGKHPADWVRSLSPLWKDIGKICFHLGENRDKNENQPFVFLATYVHRISETGQAKHMPLSMALKTYSNDRENLLRILTPLHEASEKAPFLKSVLEDKSLFKPSFRSARQAWYLLKESEVYRNCGIVVRITDISIRKPPKLKVLVEMNLSGRYSHLSPESLARFSVSAAIDGRKLTPDELSRIMSSGGGLIRVKGQWIDADTEKVAALLEKWKAAGELAGSAGISLMTCLRLFSGASSALGDFLPETPEEICDVSAGADLQARLEELKWNSGKADTASLPSALDAILRPYQKDGVRFLWNMTYRGFGVCLADDMGLGKTVQILTYLEMLREKGIFTQVPALLILPASLLKNWKSEAEKFTPALRVKVIHSSEMTAAERKEFTEKPETVFRGADVIMTTYALMTRMSALKDFTFPVIIADEAQAVKNASSQQSAALRSLKGERRIVMTGTPIENSLADLWSLFDFIMPGLLGTNAQFRDFVQSMEHGKEKQADYSPLRKLARPFILRRLKTDRSIIRDLPDKTEKKVYCGLTAEQAVFYQKAVNAMKLEMEQTDELRRSNVVLSYLMKFKQICNHPSQFSGNGICAEEKSGKFLRLRKLAEQIAARGEKVLVFTQFREMTEPLHELLSSCFRRSGLILHGGTPVEKRAEAVNLFQSDDGPPFFVLSLKAAGTGLNLTAAAHVVHFDRWWNPAVENQATDRAYRIGQHKNVLVHKFVVRGTIEEKIDAMISGKRCLADIMLRGGAEKLLTEMSPQELMDFVRLDRNAAETENDDAETTEDRTK